MPDPAAPLLARSSALHNSRRACEMACKCDPYTSSLLKYTETAKHNVSLPALNMRNADE
jgi:hypothetical protein